MRIDEAQAFRRALTVDAVYMNEEYPPYAHEVAAQAADHNARLLGNVRELYEALHGVPHMVDQAICALELINDLATPRQDWGALRGRLENAKAKARAALAKVEAPS